MRARLSIKRALDLTVSLIGLILLAIPFAIIALAIKLDSKGPVFFRPECDMGRPGRAYVKSATRFRCWRKSMSGC